MDPVPGSVVGGKYRLDRPLARGGMGAVWVGRHLDLDVAVAVKFMGPSSSDTHAEPGSPSRPSMARTRFEREAKAAASLRSPHVVQVFDYDATGDAPYIVMELLEGEDLGQRLERRGRMPLPEVARIVAELAKGLALAHEAGIVHRDLKPSNVFMARVGGDEVVKVLDFGVAKETRLDAAEGQTTTGVVIGSPSYMSPEQARGGRVDARSDLWSVGVLVFQALTGKRPFEGKNLGDVLVRICTDALPVATTIAPELPREIDRFFERALCRSPDGRYPDARALSEALSAVASSATGGSVTTTLEGLAPRDEPTGHVAARPRMGSVPTVPLVTHRAEATGTLTPTPAPRPGDESAPRAERTATLEAAGAETAAPLEVPRGDPTVPVEAPQAITGRTGSSQARPASDRRGMVWGLGGAAVVAALWIASQAGLFGGRTSGAAATPDEASRPAAPASAEPTVAPAASVAPVASGAATASASSAATSAASQSPPAPTAPAAAGRWPPRPRATGAATVDPKFGLPVGRSP